VPADAGIRFGQYVLLRRIARGGMAEVFLAQQRGLEGFDRRVAVKRILPHLADTPDFVKMFLGEAKLAAQLTHPNIVHIYDFGKVENDYFIAMEYVEGIHTGQVFKHGERELRMSPTLVARIGADASAALHYAQELHGPNGKPLGLVHRDVSPANIMVSHDGIVKLCDFGIAKAMALTDQLTNPGQVKGKYAYMSPEQTIAAPLDGRSDVFSLAIVLWELLSGKTIVPRGDAIEAMRAIRDGKLLPIERAAPDTPAQLAKAITWALEPKRERRATAAELHQALEAFIKVSPELATPMQLAAWVRSRFPRDSSGPHPARAASSRAAQGPGTSVTPGTSVSPGTMAGTGARLGPVTPSSNLIAASLVSDPDETAETVALLSSSELASLSSDELANATVLDDLSRQVREGSRASEEPEISNRPTTPRPIANRTTDRQQATVLDPSVRAADEPTALAGETMFVHDTMSDDETVMQSGAKREVVPSGPAIVPTMFHRRLEPRRKTPLPTDSTMGMRRARPRYLVPIVVLCGIAVFSFLIALAARSSPTVVPDAVDARPMIVALDAAAIAVADGPSDASPPDVREPTITVDAAATPTTLLVVHTTPTGATLKIGDQTRLSPAELALPAGTYTIVAELDGFQPERREVELIRGAHLVQEIVFSKRVGSPRPTAQLGKLTVRTNPYSDVFHGTRKLGQTPFEIELAAGTYMLLFRNPKHPTVSRTAKITAGKSTRLLFDLPR